MTPKVSGDIQNLLAREELFVDPQRPSWTNVGPHVLVVDDFYENPDELRRLGLEQTFVQYSPPTEDQVPSSAIDYSQFDDISGMIFTTALKAFRGSPVKKPLPGFRYNPPWLMKKMEELTGRLINPASWEPGGDYWNGAFNLREAGTHTLDTIHHHYHETNAHAFGWNGVIYLTPEVPPSTVSGTSFWRDRRTGRCVAGYGEMFSTDQQHFECMAFVTYKYNRLVLFRENVIHKVEGGFGRGKAARLTQSFFFQSIPPSLSD